MSAKESKGSWRHSITFVVLSLWLLPGCSTAPEKPPVQPVQRSQPLLGTFITISVFGEDREHLQEAVSAAFDEIRRMDSIMSVHRADSELTRVNQLAFSERVPLSDDLYRVIKVALDIARETDGAFDITIRPLADLWGFIWKEYRLPSEAELREVLPKVDWRAIHLSHETRSIRFSRPGISIDLGGIGKGFAVDAAITKLAELGVANAMVKAGGDLRVMGLPPGKNAWEVQLEDPEKKGERQTVYVRTGALSTSGNYENYFEIEGKRYSHILNPKSGLPVEGIAACTLLAPTCTESDAWSTACFVLGPEKGMKAFGKRFPMCFTLMADPSGKMEVVASESFPKTVKNQSNF